MSTNTSSVSIRNTHLDSLVNRGLGRVNDLRDKGIVHRFRITDDRHRCSVHDRVALSQERQMRDATHACELRRGTRDLCGRFGVTEFSWVRPNQQR